MLSWYKPVVAPIRWSSGLQAGCCVVPINSRPNWYLTECAMGMNDLVPGTSRVPNAWDVHKGLVMVQAIGPIILIMLCCVLRPNWVSRH